jgi:hypothetical protein
MGVTIQPSFGYANGNRLNAPSTYALSKGHFRLMRQARKMSETAVDLDLI